MGGVFSAASEDTLSLGSVGRTGETEPRRGRALKLLGDFWQKEMRGSTAAWSGELGCLVASRSGEIEKW